MFEQPMFRLSTKMRTGGGLWLAEGIATFGLVLAILGTRANGDRPPPPGCRRPLYSLGVLVHRLHELRQSSGHHRSQPHRYLRRNTATPRFRVRNLADQRSTRGDDFLRLDVRWPHPNQRACRDKPSGKSKCLKRREPMPVESAPRSAKGERLSHGLRFRHATPSVL
jgi:hypothetical protein